MRVMSKGLGMSKWRPCDFFWGEGLGGKGGVCK